MSPRSSFQSLHSRWHVQKRQANLPKRVGMRSLEVLAVASAMFILPTTIHRVVQAFDEVHRLLGRTARSPYSAVSWPSLLVAVLLLAGWHIWLGRLSYKSMVEEEQASTSLDQGSREEKGERKGFETRVSWGRVLGRIVIPLFLLAFAVQFGYGLLLKLANPSPLVTANSIDVKDDARR